MTSSNKRERELARAKYERQQARRSDTAARRQRRQRVVAIVVVGAMVIAFGGWVVLDRVASSDSTPVAAPPTAAPAASTPADPNAEPTAESALVCTEPGTPRPDDMRFDAAPPGEGGPGSLVLTTNCGDIVIELAHELAPKTVASIEYLAGMGFYDNTSCHRLTTEGIFVLQCGDPKGDGSGGPGYELPDENLPAEGEANYPAGTVAMANAGPGTSGSQFFIVYGDTTLPAGYTIFGTVTSGLDLVEQVAAVGVAEGLTDGAPAQPVFIESAKATVG